MPLRSSTVFVDHYMKVLMKNKAKPEKTKEVIKK